MLLPYRVRNSLSIDHDGAFVHRDNVQRSLSSSPIHTALVKTLLGLLYSLSNQCLDETDSKILGSIITSSGWDTVLPHLRDMLSRIDPRIVQAIAEGLFKESIRNCHQRMMELSLGLGADPTQHLKYFDRHQKRHVTSAPVIALCSQYGKTPHPDEETLKLSSEELIVTLLKRDPHVSNSTLLWIIRASCHAIAEKIIRNQPGRAIDFTIAVSDLENGTWLGFDTYDLVTPLLVACSDTRQSAEKLSLIRCLLERNAKADLKVMIAAAAAGDAQLISLLHQHDAPVNGFIPKLGTPLSSACNAALAYYKSDLVEVQYDESALTAIHVLLGLGASPNDPDSRELNRWEHSPLHILATADDRPPVAEALNLLFQYGVHINHRAIFHLVDHFRGKKLYRPFGCYYGEKAETALEYAIASWKWNTAVLILSTSCELTGREILFTYTNELPQSRQQPTERRKAFQQFVWSLLAKAPGQKDALHWSGRTILQCAINSDDEDMIMALFAFGVTLTSADFEHMLSKGDSNTVCRLSSSVQMELAVAARSPESPVTGAAMLRLILAFACPAVVRNVLEGCPDVYDSAGLCYLIARVVTRDRISYFFEFWEDDYQDYRQVDFLNLGDISAFLSRQTVSNRHEDWERTAVSLAARAGHADLLRMLVNFGQEDLRGSGFIPVFILKDFLISRGAIPFSSWDTVDEDNTGCLGIWIDYCRMDKPKMRCSPLTAAAMVVPETIAEEVVDLLLAQNYHPDGWTVLIASCQGYLSILQRLKPLESWPHMLSHEDRPDWCPTALQIAVYNGCVNTVRFLLDMGTVTDAMDQCPIRPSSSILPCNVSGDEVERLMPRTALQHAVEAGNMELVTLLINAGADVNAPAAVHSGATALQIASIQGSIPMVQYLLRLNADVHAEGAASHGRTALQGAAEHGRKDVVELLLDYTASTAFQHHEQIVEALFYAEKNEQHVVARILRERISSQWSLEIESTLEMLEEDYWENSTADSLHSACHQLEMEIKAWKETFEDLPDSSRVSESKLTSDVGSGEIHVELPVVSQEDDSSFPHDMNWGVDDRGGFDLFRTSEIDSHGVDISQWLTFTENDTTWLDFPMSFEGYGNDQALFDHFP